MLIQLPNIFAKLSRRDLLAASAAQLGIFYVTRASAQSNALNSTAPVTPHAFGAVGDGAADDTLAVAQALATGQSVFLPRRYRITRRLVLRSGQELCGINSAVSGILIDRSYMAGSGAVLDLVGPEPGGQVRDLFITFEQPDTTTRSNLLHYPPAIRAVNVPRFKLNRIRIERARVALDMRGNSGGATIDDFEASAFDTGIYIDGSLDSIKMTKVHLYPFGLSTMQKSIYGDSSNIGIFSGRCDDFHLSDSLIFGIENAIKLVRTKLGATFGTISSVDFDNRGGLTVEAGNLRVVGCFFTTGHTSSHWISAGEGVTSVVGAFFHSAVALDGYGISVGEGCSFQLSDATFDSPQANFTHIEIGSGSSYSLSNLIFRKLTNPGLNRPIIEIADGSFGLISGVLAPEGSGLLISAQPKALGSAKLVLSNSWQVRSAGGFQVDDISKH